MLQRRTQILRTALVAGDALVATAAWLAAYFAAARWGSFAPTEFSVHTTATLGIVLFWVWTFRRHGLYEPRRIDSPFRDLISVFQAGTLVVLLLLAFGALARAEVVTRSVLVPFWVMAISGSAMLHVVARKAVRVIHRSGFYLRPVLVVGSGRLAEELIERIQQHPEVGLRVAGVICDDLEVKRILGVPVVGTTDRIKPVLQLSSANEVILALDQDETAAADRVLSHLEDELVDVRLVPDLFQILTLRASVEDLDGLPVIGLRQSPLIGMAALQKRVFDVMVAGLSLTLALPAMAVIAAAIAWTTGRPVLYRQFRVGLDGHVFEMLKFRTMVHNAERDTGPVWATAGDRRQTRFGRFLRRTSLDELPQLWNVLRGDMSLVGPRPERPHFIERFRREVPGYMLRHKVRAGMTGWAQIHRWRGDTSLHERIEHDLYYIQNWSLALDIRILLMTLWRSRLP